MSDRGPGIGVAVSALGMALILAFAPILFGLLLLLAWCFVSIGHRAVDGVLKVAFGIAAVGIGAWNAYSTHAMLSETKLVAYAAYTYEAHIFFSEVLAVIGVILVGSGVRAIVRKPKAKADA